MIEFLVQKPVRRTITFFDDFGNSHVKNIPLPYVVYIRNTNHPLIVSVFFAKEYPNENTELYNPTLGNIFVNIKNKMCLSEYKYKKESGTELNEIIAYFWSSGFNNTLPTWNRALSYDKMSKLNLDEVLNLNYDPHTAYDFKKIIKYYESLDYQEF